MQQSPNGGVNGTSTETNFRDMKEKESRNLEEAWHILYSDCLSALEVCVEGELKHFHKARYMLAQGWYRRGGTGSFERVKDELSFCFKSSRFSFTINMWEIDSTVQKERRKTPGLAGNKKVLEVNLAESSRKFITCIRKYTLFFLKLLLESRDINMLERAYASLRADKRFSLCLEDIVPVALGRLIQAMMSSICENETLGKSFPHSLLERIFNLFIDQGSLWTDINSLPEYTALSYQTAVFMAISTSISIHCKEISDWMAHGGINEKFGNVLRIRSCQIVTAPRCAGMLQWHGVDQF